MIKERRTLKKLREFVIYKFFKNQEIKNYRCLKILYISIDLNFSSTNFRYLTHVLQKYYTLTVKVVRPVTKIVFKICLS